MKSLTALAVLLLVGAALAQESSGIAGQVVDGRTGEPVVGALVICRGETGQAGRGTTNERGMYRIGDLAPGRYGVSAQARGYAPTSYPERVEVRAGQVTENIDFRLRPLQQPEPGAISGRVVDRQTGEPIAGAVVTAANPTCRNRARTDERGRYVIRNLAPGAYGVKAEARGYVRQPYPERVTVEAGQVTEGIGFELAAKPRKGAIAGIVTDARTGEPVAGAVVVAVGEHARGKAVTGRDGRYRMRLLPGRYEVRAMARGYQPATLPRPVPVHPDQVTGNVDFALRRMHADSE